MTTMFLQYEHAITISHKCVDSDSDYFNVYRGSETFHDTLFFMLATVAVVRIHVYYKKNYPFLKNNIVHFSLKGSTLCNDKTPGGRLQYENARMCVSRI